MKKIVDELGVNQTAFDEPGPDLMKKQSDCYLMPCLQCLRVLVILLLPVLCI